MVDAHSCAPCGHTFCKPCIETARRNVNSRCQKCRSEIALICKNRFVERIMKTVEGKCKSCAAVFHLGIAAEHVTDCRRIPTKCGRCAAEFPREEEERHKEECQMAIQACECGERVLRRDQDSHREKCQCRLTPCLFGCGESVKRMFFSAHTITCGAVMMRCPIEGCGTLFKRREEDNHSSQNVQRHASLLTKAQDRLLWEKHVVCTHRNFDFPGI